MLIRERETIAKETLFLEWVKSKLERRDFYQVREEVVRMEANQPFQTVLLCPLAHQNINKCKR